MDEKINETNNSQVEEQLIENVEETESTNSGSALLYTIIGVAVLMVALVGATFAYFTTSIKDESKESINLTTSSTVSLTSEASTVSLEGITPGESEQSTFTITNPTESTTSQSYDLYLVVDENDFENTDGDGQLLVTVSDDTTASAYNEVRTYSSNISLLANTTEESLNQVIDLTDGASTTGQKYLLANDIVIASGETQSYTVTVSFVDIGSTQDTNQGKVFLAHIELADVVSVSGV